VVAEEVEAVEKALEADEDIPKILDME